MFNLFSNSSELVDEVRALRASVELRNAQWDNVAAKIDLLIEIMASIGAEMRAREVVPRSSGPTIIMPNMGGSTRQ